MWPRSPREEFGAKSRRRVVVHSVLEVRRRQEAWDDVLLNGISDPPWAYKRPLLVKHLSQVAEDARHLEVEDTSRRETVERLLVLVA